jgi:hypothetical protein
VNFKWELAVSLAITVSLFAGTILNIPPFSSVINLREKAKLSWEEGDVAGRRGDYGRRVRPWAGEPRNRRKDIMTFSMQTAI